LSRGEAPGIGLDALYHRRHFLYLAPRLLDNLRHGFHHGRCFHRCYRLVRRHVQHTPALCRGFHRRRSSLFRRRGIPVTITLTIAVAVGSPLDRRGGLG